MIPKIKRKRFTRKDKILFYREEKYDFMKHWSVIRKWAVINYDLKSSSDLDMLFFLYSERLFSRKNFDRYANHMSWDRYRFDRLLRDGFIRKFRERRWGESLLYEVSQKGKKMIANIYRKLLGFDPLPESSRRNKIFKPNAPFTHKTLSIAVKDANKDLKERKRHPSLE